MDFAPDDLLLAIQATAQRVAQDQRNAAHMERERVGRAAAVQAGLLELLAGDEPDEAPGPLAFALALHTLALSETGLALWVWAQNVAQTAATAAAPEHARTWRQGDPVAVPLDLELGAGAGWHVSCGAPHVLTPRAGSWAVHAGTPGERTTVGADGADVGLFAPTTQVASLTPPDLALATSGLAAIASGVAVRATRAAAEYALVRNQFGHPIANFQAIQFMIADSQTGAEAARLMALASSTQSDLAAAARALSCAATAARSAADVAVQVHGGAGYTRDYPAEALLRDASLLKQVATLRFTATALPPFA